LKIFDAPALILETLDLGERDRVVAFLTAEHGQRRGVARSARSKFSRFAGQLQPLAKVAMTWAEKDGGQLVRLAEAQLLRPAAALQQDLEGLLLSAYLAETIKTFAQEGEPATTLFRLLDTTIEFLLERQDPDARLLAARYLEVWVLRLSGILPVPRECPLCGRPLVDVAVLLEEEASLVCQECGRGQRSQIVGAGELEFLRRTARHNLPQMAESPTDARVFAGIEKLARTIRRHFLQHELRSYQVMKESLHSLEAPP
jgi:DNA repair protein RecO (recombination protein O)